MKQSAIITLYEDIIFQQNVKNIKQIYTVTKLLENTSFWRSFAKWTQIRARYFYFLFYFKGVKKNLKRRFPVIFYHFDHDINL